MSEQARGATANDWLHFDFALGLGPNLLPCVPAAPDVQTVPGSALEGKVGKIPSQFNRDGLAHGLLEWQKRQILPNEVALWSADRRLNLCVRTGAVSGVYAFDVDVDDDRAHEIYQAMQRGFGIPMYRRARTNSRKFLVPFRMEGVKCPKRKIFLQADHKGPAIELLADGQQFVAAGSHSSGSRYQWLPSLPLSLPTLTLEQLNRAWTALTQAFAKGTTSKIPETTATSTLTGTATGALSQSTNPEMSVLSEISDSEWNELVSALRSLTPHAGSNDLWSEIGYALLSLQHTRDTRQLFIDFSKDAPNYTEGAPERWWDNHRNQATRTDYRHIFTLARRAGWGQTSDPSAFAPIQSHGERVDGVSETSTAEGVLLDITPPPLPDRPLVQLTGSNFSAVVRQLETIIEPEVYTQGAHMVRLDDGHESAKIERSTDSKMIIEANPQWARVRLGEISQFQRWAPKKEDWYDVNPTAEHVNALCALGSWRKLRPLDAIARAPFVRVDGSICDTPGYDYGSRALLIPSADYPPVPTEPTRDDAIAALGRVRGVFDQFPWSEPAAESAFLAHVLSEAGRLALDRCPMFWYSAPDASTGKSLLQGMASRIVHGNTPSIRPWVSDGDEIRKTLFASLLAGDRSLLFDNVPRGTKVRSSELCAFITATDWTDRKLGASEKVGIPNRAVISASGNNITPVSDLARRSIVVRIDANTERLAERRFKIEDLEEYVLRNRASMLVDVLTVISAYHALGHQKEMPVALPSFVRWSRLVREPLIWLGMPDPVGTQKKETDDESQSLVQAFRKLAVLFAGREFNGHDVAHVAAGLADQSGEMASALMQAGCSEPNSPQKVGYWLRGVRDKVCAGHKLISTGYGMRGAKWYLKPTNEDLT